jgi:hypothetical protein
MKQPTTAPRIMSLRKLGVNHKQIEFQEHVRHLSRWVRRITSQSQLEHLELTVDYFERFKGPYLNYGGLVEYVSQKHGRTIRILRLMHGYIDPATITLLCQRCPNLEEVSLGVNVRTLVSLTSNRHFRLRWPGPSQREFPQDAASLTELARVAFRVCNAKPSKVAKYFTDEVATNFFEAMKHTNLRHLTVNCNTWMVSENDQLELRETDSAFP